MSSAIGPYTDREKRLGRIIFETLEDQRDNHLRKTEWDSQVGKGWHAYYYIAARAVIAAMAEESVT